MYNFFLMKIKVYLILSLSLLLNTNSLKAHIQEIRQFLHENPSYHLFGIAESKLGPVVDDNLVRIDGYTLVRQDRKLGGGGVALYVRNTLKVKILVKSNTTFSGDCNKPEYLMCSVQRGNSSPVFVAVVYRPPHVGFYANKLDEHLRACGDEFSHRIIMGDLNADLIKPNAETRVLLNFVDTHSLNPFRGALGLRMEFQ